MTTVIGLDLSLTGTGICTDDGVALLRPPKAADGLERLRWIRDRVNDHVDRAAPVRHHGDTLVVVEGLAFASLTGKATERAGLWWLVRDAIDDCHVAVVTPTGRAKYATGKGNAGKDAVMLEAARRLPELGIVDNNTADAAVLYAMGRDHVGSPVAAFPASHRVALDAVAWPDRMVARTSNHPSRPVSVSA